MAIYSAQQSAVMVNGTAVEGVRSIEYRASVERSDLHAIGSSERIAVITGARSVEGRIRVASSAPALDALVGDDLFQITAPLRHGESVRTVSFDECLLTERTFSMSAGGHGETTYAFTATRVREDA